MVALFDTPAFARWTPLASPFDLEAARRYLADSRKGDAGRIQLAITTDGRTPLGEVLAVRTQEEPPTVEIAYGVGAEHQGQGLASRSVRLMTHYAYDTLAAKRVVLRIAPENIPSQRVAQATGFHLTDDPRSSANALKAAAPP
jgi:RimJ/RimL family protein N-acetyltransferase